MQMHDLESQLRGLSTLEPSKTFSKTAKARLISRITTSDEAWFATFLKRFRVASPSPAFVSAARMRLLSRITTPKVSKAMFFMKRLAASTLVMMLAVTSTLFYVDGGQYAAASDETVLKVLTGEVTVKHADYLVWNAITVQTNLAAGDLIKVEPGSEAVIHFFDDTQMRLAGGSLVLIDRMNVSPGYARQGVIDVILHEGQAWVQTMNVDDKYAGFNMVTRDGIINALHASFDVTVWQDQPTTLRVFKNAVDLKVLKQYTNETAVSAKMTHGNKAVFTAVSSDTKNLTFDRLVDHHELSDRDHSDYWVVRNKSLDRDHLALIRMQEFDNLKRSVGVLPGQFLYPVKQVKERLALALSFSDESSREALISIANKRLQEAIVLMEKGQATDAQEALMAYQAAAREIAAESNASELAQVSNNIVSSHQKTLVAALPSSPSATLINEALFETEELFVSDVVKREQVRLNNATERLNVLQELITEGNIEAAKEVLVKHEAAISAIVEGVDTIESDEEKKALLDAVLVARQEELSLIEDIQEVASLEKDVEFIAMLASATEATTDAIKRTVDLIEPLQPTIVLAEVSRDPIEVKAENFLERVYIYSSWTGQRNQIDRLLKDSNQAGNIDFLNKVKEGLDARGQQHLNSYILEAQRQEKVRKDLRVRRKIERAKRINN